MKEGEKNADSTWQILSISLFPGSGPATVFRSATSVYSLVSALARDSFGKSRNTFITPRRFPECYLAIQAYVSGLDLCDTKPETRHSDDTFHTRHVRKILSRALPLKLLGISDIYLGVRVIPSRKKFPISRVVIGDSISRECL